METKSESFQTGDSICKKLGFKSKGSVQENWPKGSKFLKAEEVENIADQLIEKYLPHLSNYNVGYLFKEKASKSTGGHILGKARTESDMEQVLHGYEAVIVIGFDKWIEADLDGKFRLVYHELLHLYEDPEKASMKIINHSVEEFPEVIAVFGPSQESHVQFIQAYDHFKQNNI
ncbi:MAG: hypothetical protein M0R17_09090 [Candidatus Omnitrophica bacterium]|jgi:hypothetical protein|nr:hypothetical protein [Candidatus Omnitrophota bacterium]